MNDYSSLGNGTSDELRETRPLMPSHLPPADNQTPPSHHAAFDIDGWTPSQHLIDFVSRAPHQQWLAPNMFAWDMWFPAAVGESALPPGSGNGSGNGMGMLPMGTQMMGMEVV
jgi:hypothetical protein